MNAFNGLAVDKDNFKRGYDNNCYTYAINQFLNPYTKKAYDDYADCQPGMLGGRNKFVIGSRTYSRFLKFIRADLKDIGFTIRKSTYEEYVEDPTAWKIAYCYCRSDYHFYRQNNDGTWSHKQGPLEVITTDHSGNPIINPQTCDRGKYDKFGGFFIITPKK